MRITTLIIGIQACCSALLLANGTKAQTISIDVKQVSVTQLFKTIESQAGVTFTYNENTVKELPAVTLKITNKPLTSILKEIEKITPLQFKQQGNLVGVSRVPVKQSAKEPEPEQSKLVVVPPVTITGKIIGENKEPLHGASVRVKGSSQLTITDDKGEFQLQNVAANTTLIISYIGYVPKEVNTNTGNPMTVILEKSESKLDEVVIIPYGTTTQRLNTGSVTKVTSDEILSQPINNPLEALEGRVPGLVVTQSNGVPGSPFRVELRGQTSLATSAGAPARTINSDPLFIIDGIPFAPNNTALNMVGSVLTGAQGTGGLSPFSTINPADIESIEVLKDADATAIYGSRGGNGVILITTKKGKAGKTVFNANVYTGISQDTHIPQMMNTQQYLQMRTEAFKNDGITPNTTNAPDLTVYDPNRYTNFPKMFLGGNAPVTDVQTSLSGGNQNTSFLISGGFHHEGTVFPGDQSDDRASVHININNTSDNKKFNTIFSMSYTHEENNVNPNNLVSTINLEPNLPQLTDAQGNLIWSYNGVSFNNPLADFLQKYNATTDNLISNLQIGYEILKGLTVKSNFGYNKVNVQETETFPSAADNPIYAAQGSSEFGANNFVGWSIEPQIEYNSHVSSGKLNILLGGTLQYNENDNSAITGIGYVNDALLNSVGAAGTLFTTTDYSQYKYEAYFGRINYNWNDKYILNLTARRDGSSRFGPDKQFSNFGAVGAAWLFSNVSAVKATLPFLSYGKLRGSYGITGTDQIGNYGYLDSWSVTTNPYQGNPGLYPTRLANPNYSWEKNDKFEVGLELGFFKDRFLLSADYFSNTSSNHLISYAEPSQTGFTTITENFPAVISNTGEEFSLTTKNFTGAIFKWRTSANITFAQNKLASFPGIASSSYSGIYQVGQSLDEIRGYQYLGINPATGVPQFKDVNGDGVYNSKDLVNLGSLNPPWYGGISNTLNYKQFQLDFFLEFKKQLGRNYLNYSFTGFAFPGTEENQPTSLLNRWQTPGENAMFPKYTTTNTNAALYSGYNNFLISDASYLRLKSVSFGYNVPNEWIKRLHLQSLRLYVQGQNLLTITKFKITDPETQLLTDLPPLRTITAGIQLSL